MANYDLLLESGDTLLIETGDALDLELEAVAVASDPTMYATFREQTLARYREHTTETFREQTLARYREN